MNLRRLRLPHSGTGWLDEPDETLVAELETLAVGQPPDVDGRVARSQGALIAEFRRMGSWPHAQRATGPVRLLPAVAAAVLLIALTAGGIVASAPGLPLYGVRLATEELFLPAGGTERVMAQLDRLERRLDEAEAAAKAGDLGAAAAALAAYQRIAEQLQAGQRPDSAQRVTVVNRLEAQVQRLVRLQLIDQEPEPSAALRAANGTLAWIGGAGPVQPSQAPGWVTPAPISSPSASGNSSASPGQSESPGPAGPSPSPSAHATSSPGSSGSPAASGQGGPNGSSRPSDLDAPNGSGGPG
jgi:hypothetical protein